MNKAHAPAAGGAGAPEVVVARVMVGDTLGVAEQLLDRELLADLVLEGIEESQRTRGAHAQTTWWDAAAAADLILFHVNQLAGDP